MASTFTASPSGYVLSPSLLVWVASQVGFYSDLVGRVGDADLTWVVDKVLVVGCCLLLSNALYIFDMRCFPWGISDIQKGITSSSSFDILTTRTSDFSKKEPLQEQLGINADKPSLGHFWQRLLQERMETQQGVPSILHIDIVYIYICIIWTHNYIVSHILQNKKAHTSRCVPVFLSPRPWVWWYNGFATEPRRRWGEVIEWLTRFFPR